MDREIANVDSADFSLKHLYYNIYVFITVNREYSEKI